MKHEGIEKLAEIIHEFFLEPENKKAFEEWKKERNRLNVKGC